MKSIIFIAASIVLCTSDTGVSAIQISQDPLYKDNLDAKRAEKRAKKEAEEIAEAARIKKAADDARKKEYEEQDKKEKAEKDAAKAAKKAKVDAYNKELEDLRKARSHANRCREGNCRKVKIQDGHDELADDEETLKAKMKIANWQTRD